MGNKQGSLSNHLETASKTGALAFPGKVREFELSYFIIVSAKNVINFSFCDSQFGSKGNYEQYFVATGNLWEIK